MMVCRVGMSTNPDGRIAYWREKEGHTHGKILRRNLTCKQALNMEKSVAKRLGCKSGPGGRPVPGRVWSVYQLSGGR